jgi:hypothetical protein
LTALRVDRTIPGMTDNKDQVWADYGAAEIELHDAIDEGGLSWEQRWRIDNAYADCIRTARREVLANLKITYDNQEGLDEAIGELT